MALAHVPCDVKKQFFLHLLFFDLVFLLRFFFFYSFLKISNKLVFNIKLGKQHQIPLTR